MKNPVSSDFKLGVLGGGQLGRMLVQEAINLDIAVDVLDPDPTCSCASICNTYIQGSFKDFDTVYKFGKKVDVLTIEIEHVDTAALEKLEMEGVKVFPQPSALRIIQDKGLQKKFYAENNLPTSPFRLISGKEELNEQVSNGVKFPFVIKTRTAGYDGKGVFVIQSEKDLQNVPDQPLVLEEAVKIKKEISVIVARNEAGEIKSFPPVEMEFNPEANLVEFLLCPAEISETQAAEAEKIALKTIEAFGITGILAVEMFVDEHEAILINEVAPRPHNSGHHTIECLYTSQYEQHLRAILNMPLGSTRIIQPGVMLNLLGEPGYSGAVYYEGLDRCLAIEGVFPHIYGKKETRPFRKMGHVTIIGENASEARNRAEFVKKTLKVISK